MNLQNLNRNSMSPSTGMNQTSLSFSKTAAVQSGEKVVEQKLLTKHNDIGLVDFVDQNIEKFHVGYKEVIPISDGVGVTSSPRKLQRQLVQQGLKPLPSKEY